MEIHRPLANDGVEQSLHELREVYHGKSASDFSALLSLRDNLAKQAHRGFLGTAQFRRADRVHRARHNHGLPQRPALFRYLRESFIKMTQALSGRRFAVQLGLEAFRLTRKRAPSHFAQHRIFARKVAEESRLADVENLDDIVDPGVVVSAFAKHPQRGFDNLLAQPGFLALPKSDGLGSCGSLATLGRCGSRPLPGRPALRRVCKRRRRRTLRGCLGVAHRRTLSQISREHRLANRHKPPRNESHHNIIVTNVKQRAHRGPVAFDVTSPR